MMSRTTHPARRFGHALPALALAALLPAATARAQPVASAEGAAADGVYAAGRAALRAGDREGARSRFAALLRDDPASPLRCEVLRAWAQAHESSGDPEDAVVALRAWRALADGEPRCAGADSAALAAARLLARAGRLEEAEAAFRALRSRLPTPALAPEALFAEAEALEARAQHRDAAERFESLARQFPRHEWAQRAELRAATLRLRLGERVSEAEAVTRRVMSSPDSLLRAEAALALAEAADRRGDAGEAARGYTLFARALPADPRTRDALALAAGRWSEADRHAEAAASWAALAAAAPDDPGAPAWRLEQARALRRAGRTEEALALLAALADGLGGRATLERARILLASDRPRAISLLESLAAGASDALVAGEAAVEAVASLTRPASGPAGDALRAAAISRGLRARFPAHREAPRLWAAEAASLAGEGVTAAALASWRSFSAAWPEAAAAAGAAEAVRRLEARSPAAGGAALDSLASLLFAAARNGHAVPPEASFLLRAADGLRAAGLLEARALELYGLYLDRIPLDQETARVLLYRGECGLRASQEAMDAGDPAGAAAFRAAAHRDLARVWMGFPSSPWAGPAFMAAAGDSVARYQGESQARDLLEAEWMQAYLNRFPQGGEREAALGRLLRANARRAATHDAAWREVERTAAALAAEFPRSALRGEARILAARATAARGDLRGALAELDASPADSTEARLGVMRRWLAAQWAESLGDEGRAAREYEGLLAAFPGSLREEEAALRAGRIALRRGDAAAAVELASRVAREESRWRHEATLVRAEAEARLGHEREALRLLAAVQREAGAGPSADEAMQAHARILAAQGDHRGAMEVARRLLARTPSPAHRARALFELAEAEFQAGQYAEAAGHFAEHLTAAGAAAEPAAESGYIAALYRQGQAARGDEALARFEVAHPAASREKTRLRIEKAAAHLAQGQTDAALQALTRARESEGGAAHAAEIDLHLGRVYAREGHHDEAERIFRRAWQADSLGETAAAAAMAEGESATALGAHARAAEAFARAASRARGAAAAAEALEREARAREAAGDYAGAAAVHESLARRDPMAEGSLAALLRSATDRLLVGDAAGVIAALDPAILGFSAAAAAEARFRLGEARAASGDPAGAALEFRAATRVAPGATPWAPEAALRLAGLLLADGSDPAGAERELRGVVDRFGRGSDWGLRASALLERAGSGGGASVAPGG